MRRLSFYHDDLLLQGALHLPAGAGPHPAVALLPGHGLRTSALDPGASFGYLLPLIGRSRTGGFRPRRGGRLRAPHGCASRRPVACEMAPL